MKNKESSKSGNNKGEHPETNNTQHIHAQKPGGIDAETHAEPSDIIREEEVEKEQDEQAVIVEAYEAKIAEMQSRLDEAKDKFLRLFSEFDNYRKRANKERITLIETAAEGTITALLPVLDDLERASKIANEKQEKNAEEEGVILIYNKLKNLLRQKGVEEIKTERETFNTDNHEAITHVPAENKKQKGQIIEEIQKGYLLNGKVIRYAKVVVAK